MLLVFKKLPMLSRVLVFLVFPLTVLCGYFYKSFLLDSLPASSGTYYLEGINDEILIERDEYGVVYINASNDEDVYFATGYVHAQDRLWQLELQKRIGQGRLSELFGRKALAKDIWIRTLGLYPAAEASLPYLSQEAVKSLEAYSAGINAWVRSTKRLPVEFTIHGIEPEPWTKVDSLTWTKVFAMNLAGNYRKEIQKFIGTQHFTNDQMQTFFPEVYSDIKTSRVHKDSEGVADLFNDLHKLQMEIESELKIGGPYVGSNGWVVSGKLTESGVPIIANDPHLGLQLPSLWYAISQEGRTLAVDGMTLVGVPLVIFGKNKRIAWGGTSMIADVQDLYLEQVNPLEPTKYLVDGQWIDFETQVETIKVKADFPASLRAPLKPIEIQIRRSIHGPIISDVVKGVKQPVAMRWTALDTEDTTYESFYRLSFASNWTEFKKALSFQMAPAMNFLYADKSNIGMIGAGKIPLRRRGDGSVPVSGADSSYGWIGYIAADEMPQYFNPKEGYLINANNSIASEDYQYFISQGFAPGYRARRIEELIKLKSSQSGNKLTVADMQEIQADVKDLSSLKLLSRLQKLKSNTKQQQSALDILKKWEGVASKNSVGATIFYGWVRHIRSSVFNDELKGFWNFQGQEGYLTSLSKVLTNDQLSTLLAEGSVWCDNVLTASPENCDDILSQALSDFLEEMSKLSGTEIQNWQWGNVQQTLYSHTPFSNIKIVKNLFERRVYSGGAEHTINVASSSFDKTEGYLKVFGAGFRQIMNVDDKHKVHVFMNSTGQSGQVASRHYDDMVSKFADVEFTSLSKENRPVDSFILTPSSQGELE